jgi:hypothetical protein
MPTRTARLALTAAALVSASLATAAPSSAAPSGLAPVDEGAVPVTTTAADPDPEPWREVFDFGRPEFCEAVGAAGQFVLHHWDADEWKCVGSTLWVRD